MIFPLVSRRPCVWQAEGRAAREEAEARTTSALAELPSKRWDEAREEEKAMAADAADEEAGAECCLCMEVFSPEDQVRLLPCRHVSPSLLMIRAPFSPSPV